MYLNDSFLVKGDKVISTYFDNDIPVNNEIPFEELSEEVKSNLNEILLDILQVMGAKDIYKSTINSFCYNLEQKLILNANEYLKDIFEDINTPLEFDENYTLTFGKYSGQRLIDVNRFAPDYIAWCEENLHKPDLLKMIKTSI